jgi:hypothetical protein
VRRLELHQKAPFPRSALLLCRECRVVAFRQFSFALDLKSEFKKNFHKNVLSILLENTVGTGSIKISRTVLPGWDPDKKQIKMMNKNFNH